MQKCFIFVFFLFSLYSYGQYTIKGVVTSKTGTPLPATSVICNQLNTNALVTYGYTDNNGKYLLTLKTQGTYILSFTSLGYEKSSDTITVAQKTTLLKNKVLEVKTSMLDAVIIKSSKPITIKKDTVIFNVKSFIQGNEKVIEDLLKNLPGVEVSSDGTIKAQGKEIEKLMVDGDDFFEKGYKVLSKTLPVTPIEKVELFQNFSNNPLLKGIEESNKVALNLVLKEDAKRLWFGSIKGGYGLEFSNRYDGTFNLANFGKKNKYYFLSNVNNIGNDVISYMQPLIKPVYDNTVTNTYKSTNNLITLSPAFPFNFRENRTLFNEAKLGSVNAIFNPNKKIKIKLISFLTGDSQQFFRNFFEAFSANEINFTNTEAYTLDNSNKTVFSKLDFLYQISPSQTFKTETRFKNSIENHSSRLLFNTTQSIEALDANQIYVDQKITYTNKIEAQKAVVLKGHYVKEEKPQEYSVNQFLFGDLFPNNTNANSIAQQGAINTDFIALEGHFFSRNTKDNLLEIKLGNNYKRDALKTELSLFENELLLGTPQDFQNNIKYTVNDLYLDTKYTLGIKKVRITGRLGAHQLFNNLQLTANPSIAQSPFFVNPTLNVLWAINPKNRFRVSYSYNTTNAEILEVYDNFALTGYRSLNKGTGNFNQLQKTGINFNYTLGNWADRFFNSMNASYIKDHDFFTSSAIVQQNFSQSQKIVIQDRESFNVNTTTDYYFKLVKSNIKLNLGYSRRLSKNVINNSAIRAITSSNYNYGFELRSAFRGVFNYHLGSSWTATKVEVINSNNITNNVAFLDTYFNINEAMNIELKAENYYFGNLDANERNYRFLDLAANYFLNENKFVITLSGKNLLNTENYKINTISDTGTATLEYRLLPRYLLLELEYRF